MCDLGIDASESTTCDKTLSEAFIPERISMARSILFLVVKFNLLYDDPVEGSAPSSRNKSSVGHGIDSGNWNGVFGSCMSLRIPTQYQQCLL